MPQMMFMIGLLFDSVMIELDEISVSSLPNGKLSAVPITAAAAEIAKYFTRY